MNSQVFSTIRAGCDRFVTSLDGAAIVLFSVADFGRMLHSSSNFLREHFTEEEILYCKNRLPSLAGRYAAKLSIREALRKDISLLSLAIVSSHSGQPIARDIPDISVSITHEEDLVAAFAARGKKGSVVAVGVDAASNIRLEELAAKQSQFLSKILTAREIQELTDGTASAAEKWSGKEAVSKVLGSGIWHGGILRNIEIVTEKGKPLVVLSGKILKQAESLGFAHWEINYVQDELFTLAFVLARG